MNVSASASCRVGLAMDEETARGNVLVGLGPRLPSKDSQHILKEKCNFLQQKYRWNVQNRFCLQL